MQSGVLQAGIAAAAIFVSACVPARQQDEKVVPVHEEPRHHLVFDGADARILDIQIPPGNTTLFHTHSNPVLYVNMSSSRTRSQTLGRDWSGGDSSQPAAGRGVQSSGTAGTASNPVAPSAEPVAGRMNSVTGYSTR